MTLGPDDVQGNERFEAFRTGLRELGWREGRSLQIKYRAERDASRVSTMVDELLRFNPEVVLAAAPSAVAAWLIAVAIGFSTIMEEAAKTISATKNET